MNARYGDKFPMAKYILIDFIYVDEIILSAYIDNELILKQNYIIQLLQSQGCKLKK